MNEEYMAFEICGNMVKLSEYDDAIIGCHDKISNYYDEIKEFPYTVRSLTKGTIEIIKEAPLFILYRNWKKRIKSSQSNR